jgi:hypothetical protein
MDEKVICPAIYKHFKNEIQPDKYIYATIATSTPKDREFIDNLDSDNWNTIEYINAKYTEDNTIVCIYKCKEKYYHLNLNTRNHKLVLYKSLYDESGVYARPLEMFTSKVDKIKYPSIRQNFRFELVKY